MRTPVMFRTLRNNTPFSPPLGSVGCNNVYIKKENGVCPQVGTREHGIFWPDDRVVETKLPDSIMKIYR